MEPKLLLSTPRIPSSIASLPLFISFKAPFIEKPKLYSKTLICLSSNESLRTPFLGQTLNLKQKIAPFGNLRRTHVPFSPIRAVVKRRKEIPFDNVIQRDKKLKMVLKLRKILVKQPNRIMALRLLGPYRRFLGLKKGRRFIALLKKFPAVFEIVEEGAFSLRFRMTPEAERLYLEELKIRNEMEDLLVLKLRKLLMMSIDKRILIEKIAHLKTDLGLPLEFRDTICSRYPQYFRVVMTGRGPALELTHWDDELAISAAEIAEEESREREIVERDLIIDRPPKFKNVKLPKGLKLSKSEMRRISQFRDIPFISPYSDFSSLKSGTPEKEKHACAVIHEILSLTVEKKTLVDHLTHFRDEFRFSQQLRGMLIRHPDMFYVSLKGDRDSVFLREAYKDSHLIDKDRLLLIKEKLRSLVAVPRFRGRGAAPMNDVEREEAERGGSGGDEDEEEEEWSEIDDVKGEFDDDDFEENEDGEIFEDDWSDDEDEVALEDHTANNEEKNHIPVLPDGRPRERW